MVSATLLSCLCSIIIHLFHDSNLDDEHRVRHCQLVHFPLGCEHKFACFFHCLCKLPLVLDFVTKIFSLDVQVLLRTLLPSEHFERRQQVGSVRAPVSSIHSPFSPVIELRCSRWNWTRVRISPRCSSKIIMVFVSPTCFPYSTTGLPREYFAVDYPVDFRVPGQSPQGYPLTYRAATTAVTPCPMPYPLRSALVDAQESSLIKPMPTGSILNSVTGEFFGPLSGVPVECARVCRSSDLDAHCAGTICGSVHHH